MFTTYWIYFEQSRSSNKTHKNNQRSSLLQLCEHDSNDPLTRKSWIPQAFLKKIPLEPIIKMLIPGLGIFAELCLDVRFDREAGRTHLMFTRYTLQLINGRFFGLSRFYHVCLYSTFSLSGIIDLVSLCVKLPRAVSQLFLCFAFYAEALLFSFHVHGRDPFNNAVHQLLLIFIVSCGVFATLRLLNPRNLLFNAGLAGSLILQGTHLIQAGWILFGGTKWDIDWPQNQKFLGALSVFHLFSVSVIMMITFLVMKAVLNRLAKTKRFSYLSLNNTEEERVSLLTLTADDMTLPEATKSRHVEMNAIRESPA